ncbi:MAG: hypothetical protein CFE34_01500 [Rhodobacteraceae bacterium PARR1]|nr:MAG: hypothetical protein CFE34_01500 [Rhodobacteraceae bacterium PARR1]
MFTLRHPTIDDLRQRRLVIGLGAMKSGTTWLSDYLGRHPGFFHAPIKEMNVFNRRWPNPLQGDGPAFRLWRMEEIVLDPSFPRSGKLRMQLRALAELGRIETDQDYLAFFARRMRGQGAFGEISPSYALLPPEALRQMAGLTDDVRFVFLMRDPVARMASQIQHLRRRLRRESTVDEVMAEVLPGSPLWQRGEYGRTLDALAVAGVRFKVLIYEDMFQDSTIRDLCHWLGLAHSAPDFAKRLNVAQGDPLTGAQLDQLRDKLAPVYADLAARFGADRPMAWRWERGATPG